MIRMIRKILVLSLLAAVAGVIGMTIASREEIVRYRSLRDM